MTWTTFRTPALLVVGFALLGCPAPADDADGPPVCELGDEPIELEPLRSFDDVFLEGAECVVQADGFQCGDDLLVVDPLFEPFGPVPWTQGATVRLTTNAYFFGVTELVIHSEENALLAVYAESRPPGTVEPIQIDVEPVPDDCQDDESREVTLGATYSAGDESISLAGSRSGEVGGFRLYQAGAEDLSAVSSGEINEAVSFVAIAAP